MNEFFENFKREAEANPTVALVVVTGLLTAAAKLIHARGQYKGSRAFARDVERRIKRDRKA